jgi:molybdopterin/thiamine biosynthesis adenylyltransferase
MAKDSLVIDDGDRYSRFRLIAWWDQEKLARARFLVVGAGALGNEVLKNLALLGVGHIHVVDFDRIEESNLTRSVLFRRRDCGRSKVTAAAEALEDLNPDTQVHPIEANIMTDIGLGLFNDVDVVIGCLDNREARLWVNRCCWKVGTPWIDGGIQEINGVVKVFVPPGGSCYECAMTETDYRLINLRYSCPLLRQEDLQAGKVPTAPTISSMIGGLQTQEALKLIHGLDVSEGQALVYNGVANQFYSTRYQRREDCLSHETYPEAVSLPLSAAKHTALELFEHVARETGTEAETCSLMMDRDLVVSIDCKPCGNSRRVMRPLQLVGMSEATCPSCGGAAHPKITHQIDAESLLAREKLKDLGVPAYDILRVAIPGDERVFLLADDRQKTLGTAETPEDEIT